MCGEAAWLPVVSKDRRGSSRPPDLHHASLTALADPILALSVLDNSRSAVVVEVGESEVRERSSRGTKSWKMS
jgi:hypothetical protein